MAANIKVCQKSSSAEFPKDEHKEKIILIFEDTIIFFRELTSVFIYDVNGGIFRVFIDDYKHAFPWWVTPMDLESSFYHARAISFFYS